MFEEEYRNRINKGVGYIEENLDKTITLHALAKQAGISQFHLHRLFLVYTGEPVSGFIRRTRLAAGFSELRKGPKTNNVNSAIAVGYDSVSSFVRAFRQRFGFTPKSTTHSGKSSLSLWRTQKSDTAKVVIEPARIEMRSAQALFGVLETGYKNRSFQQAAERAFNRTLQLVGQNNLHKKVGRACAVMFDDPDLSDALKVKYFGGFEWLETSPPSFEGLDDMTLPFGTHAVFVHRGSYKSLWQTWNSAYRNWLPNSDFDLRDTFPFEIYLNDPRTIRNEKELITEIYIPVERRYL